MEQKDALQYLVGLGNPGLVEVDNRSYSALDLNPIRNPEAKPLTIHTLTGLVDYMGSGEMVSYNDKGLFVHVLSPSCVNLYGGLQEEWKQRDHYLAVEFEQGSPFQFNRFYGHEEFIIELQAKFVQDKVTAQILGVVGNITESAAKTVIDDGTSQEVITKFGIQKKEEKVPNPVTLHPYRTFGEVKQPPGSFVLRLKSGKDGSLPMVALFDADGGQWKLEAIESIKTWLAGNLPDVTIIA